MKSCISVLIVLMVAALSISAQETVSVSYFGVVWSPDSKYVSFAEMRMKNSKPPSRKMDVYIMKADGSDMKKITGDQSNATGPSWSKDGNRIFFRATSPTNNKEGNIFSIKRDGTDLIQLTKGGQNSSPVVSPDGEKIVFNAETVEHKPQIYVMNIDGSGVKALTDDNTVAFYNPVWSPNGKKIVYYVEKGDQMDQIWTMDADGTYQKLLTMNIGHNFYPSWSADGKQIVFSSTRDGEKGIYTMNVDGSKVKRLPGVRSFYARYSPDRRKIAFLSGEFPQTNIFTANADGSNQVQITK